MLPRGARATERPAPCAPVARGGGYEFENDRLRARILPTGTIVDLEGSRGGNVIAQANLLAWYRDRPRKWEAWNVDAGYERTRRAARPQPARVVDGGLEIPFDAAGSPVTMRLSLGAGEAFLRVEAAVDWRARRRLLRVENWLALDTEEVVYGAPHGVVTRSARTDTPERRAQFEVPGQRFAFAQNAHGAGLACLSLDTYGWNGRALGRGGLHIGHSLLRGTTWPDPSADVGEHRLSWGYAPTTNWSVSDVERAWLRFAVDPAVRLFESETDGVLVVACKPAQDGDGVIVRVRECDGRAASLAIRCGGRMREVAPVDGLERPLEGTVRIEQESILTRIGAFALRSFRVRF
jgi:alpha-mannosidase